MADEVVATKSLEERITARLHESISELVTEADLKQIVERGVEDFFFKPRKERHGHDGWTRDVPPLITELVDKHLKTAMERTIGDWLVAHPDQLQRAMDDAIRRGVADALTRTLDERFRLIFENTIQTLRAQQLLP